MRFFPKQVFAIDIDHKLIKNAKKTLYSISSKDKNYHDIVSIVEEQVDEKQSA
jgi:chemotaxis methyl-accepting protein methylase